jgi:hypothetical protein
MAGLYMLPSFPSIFKKKSRGLTSPTFLRFQKQKRKRRRALKKIFKKMRKKLLRKAFKNIYFHEKKLDCISWKLIEKRFLEHTGTEPPPAIIYWFLDD